MYNTHLENRYGEFSFHAHFKESADTTISNLNVQSVQCRSLSVVLGVQDSQLCCYKQVFVIILFELLQP